MKAELIDSMGDDLRVVNAARVSFNKESWYENEEAWLDNDEDLRVGEPDIKLINYLAKHNHWTPFSHVIITMRETVPIFVARQRFKHMVGFTYNEVSRRYVDDAPDFFVPDKWRKAAENAKQGSSNETIHVLKQAGKYGNARVIGSEYLSFYMKAKDFYKELIDSGVAPEQARMVLPQSMYTSYYVTGSLAAWARAYKLRIDPHAQKEIQDLAIQWGNIIGSIPELKHSWGALTKNEA